ncbi:hypothetical protein LCGC14_0792010 [marine sediment metagenome]|uniref:DUF7768 domain-containing protein n=1 Tax=marine sediment metagenome TaxID=412755 RepID=A0A0F9SC79_9ZZZZ
MKIFICSRLRGDIENNIKRAKQFSREVMLQGHFPLTPHIYFTLFLDELKEEERNIGINAGLEWIKECDEVWVFDNELSEGMKKEIEFAKKLNKKIVMK